MRMTRRQRITLGLLRLADLVELAENCGIGGGGFEKGNTCAKGDGSSNGGTKERTYSIKIAQHGEYNQDKAAKVFNGRRPAPRRLADLVGAPDGADVEIHTGLKVSEVGIEFQTEEVYGERRLKREHITAKEQGLVMYNESFHVKSSAQGKGVGTRMLWQQVQQCREQDVVRIKTFADRGEGVNGYYTWARLGYDAELHPRVVDDVVRAHDAPRPPGKPERISDLMRTEEGRQWWKKYGWPTMMSFDPSPGSLSSQILEAYVKEKGYDA